MMIRALIAVVSFLLVSVWCTRSSAIIQFHNEFRAAYLAENKDKGFVKLATEAKCYICHVGKKRTNRNAYGQQLAELLDKTKDKANKKKIREALEKVAAMHSDPEDEKSPTFGELIKAGKLPGGEVQKEDPKTTQ
jgi:hypothetical protein